MNLLPKITLFATTIFALFLQCSEITIRHAQLKDLPQLTAINEKVANEYFTNIIVSGYPDSPIAQNPQLLHEYLDSVTHRLNTLFAQKLNSNHDDSQHILVAVDERKPQEVLGLCFSEKRDAQAYIRYIIVAENFHRKGIGSQLLSETVSLYSDVDSCALRTFSHANEKVHAFYEKNGFTSNKELVTLLTKHTAHSDTITFVHYNLDLKK